MIKNVANIGVKYSDEMISLESFGNWEMDSLKDVADVLKNIEVTNEIKAILWDFHHVESFDSSGIVTVIKFIQQHSCKELSYSFIGLKPEHQRMLLFYRKNTLFEKKVALPRRAFFDTLGRKAFSYIEAFIAFLTFLGEISYQLYKIILKPSLFRFKATIKHIESSGFRALPIIGLTAFLIGLVTAYQGATQLAKFGANIFIVEMVSISIFRELAPLMAAIVIAGRSASAYTAEIGTMKITEEIDALRTMGFNPINFLVIPRIFALMISMPLIVFFADMMGLFGGMLIASSELSVSFIDFVHRLQNDVAMKHIVIGLIKAPIFAIVIATIGTFRGFQVSGSTDSIGNFTTISVVNAIFWVIVLNAIISVLLTEVGI